MLTINIYDSYEQQLDIDEKDYFSDIYRLRKSSQIIQMHDFAKFRNVSKQWIIRLNRFPHLWEKV